MSRRALLLVPVALAAGCGGRQSSLDPAGEHASRISDLYWLYFAVCAVVYVVMLGFILAAFARRRTVRPPAATDGILRPSGATEHRLGQWVWGGVIVTAVILFVLLVAEVVTGRNIQRSLGGPDPVSIKVTARQWWWEVRYNDPTPSEMVTTANEIHVPVGRPVHVDLDSPDVIHSFWIPNFHGKKDAIPGHSVRTTFQADRPGTYWGQCAEFCGLQHANMRFVVTAESEAEFQAWLANQRKEAPEPVTDGQKKGREAFVHGTCATCHTIQGTPAGGKVGPDLTHIASRPRIAAGTLPMTRGHLAGWISDPHSIKPGVRMPANPLKPDELQALLDYLESLK
jgi:cytochrome c oxidase subunit II